MQATLRDAVSVPEDLLEESTATPPVFLPEEYPGQKTRAIMILDDRYYHRVSKDV